MIRRTACLLSIGLLLLTAAGVAGCGGGTESGTTQITDKAAPDPELNPAQSKVGKQAR
jgi:hypothetical protein